VITARTELQVDSAPGIGSTVAPTLAITMAGLQ